MAIGEREREIVDIKKREKWDKSEHEDVEMLRSQGKTDVTSFLKSIWGTKDNRIAKKSHWI